MFWGKCHWMNSLPGVPSAKAGLPGRPSPWRAAWPDSTVTNCQYCPTPANPHTLTCTAQFLRSCSLQSLSHPPIRCPVLPLILCKRMASPLDHLTLAPREERREKKERQERRAESGERRERSKGTESWEMREGGGFSTLVSKLRFRNVVSEILFQSFRSRTLIWEL